MFRNLLSRLFADMPGSAVLNSQDGEVAIAALLVRIARADDRYSETERRRIEGVLARRRGLSHDEAVERRVAAEMIEAEAPDTVRFTRIVKERVDLDDRQNVIAAMWEVAYADGKRSAEEDSMVRLVASLLGVNDRDSNLVRQRVLDDLGIRGH
ncbi:TerB family tellurite resistance protein [Paracoccus shanxieyensis]|uniref:TerB family tellurite resistance protein n=1 Tax=Paracoccus shanxieyensis TaxID=2675752 RepID=A0A6L6IX58_9RHOB|nr:TerB family tellurite resistance protein [Paracoccus shanxieyensis]MTH64793.1 TerB family tellurite resistance protein [Paracoccus shanxieyensis]MTH87974.1 TerB family tellurite resistance protein [Paracoccus shanxieyensis]